MKLSKKVLIIFFIFLAVLGLNSCIGASADISIRANGSGSMALEYRVPMMLESIGRLDGNERWPIIPVGRADFERSLARIPGLHLKSFSSREVRGARAGNDLLVKAVLEFDDTASLLNFLDLTGSHASLTQDNQNLLRIVLADPSPQAKNADLISLLKEVSAGYELQISMSAPQSASLAVYPSNVQGARVVSQGRKVSFAIGTGELLSLSEGLVLEMRW